MTDKVPMQQQAAAKMFVFFNGIDSTIKQKQVQVEPAITEIDKVPVIRITLQDLPASSKISSHIEEIRPVLEKESKRTVRMHPAENYLDFHGSMEDLANLNTGKLRTALRESGFMQSGARGI